ncbi:MAG: ATP-dependent Clp protease adaptor ClpS [Actinomycetota bacterium]|nr:ATP-dependent Clp protease adaptor ClpS [Actinomycetota bacterium]
MSTVQLPRVREPGSGTGGFWRVLVLNDDHNTFDHVAETLASVVPGVSLADGYRIADRVHNKGSALVWSGPREDAEYYWLRLDDAGLTLAPLENG